MGGDENQGIYFIWPYRSKTEDIISKLLKEAKQAKQPNFKTLTFQPEQRLKMRTQDFENLTVNTDISVARYKFSALALRYHPGSDYPN